MLIFLGNITASLAQDCPLCGNLLKAQASATSLLYCSKCQKHFNPEDLDTRECAICRTSEIETIQYPCCGFRSCRNCTVTVVYTQRQCPQCRHAFSEEPNLRMYCPIQNCSFVSAQALTLREHLLTHAGELFLGDLPPVIRYSKQQQAVICRQCRSGIASATTAALNAAAMSDHIQAYHQSFTCLCCESGIPFEGREALLKHVIDSHCATGCCFANCDAMLTELQLYEHISAQHSDYYSFWQQLSVGQPAEAEVNERVEVQAETLESTVSDQPEEVSQPIEESGEDSPCANMATLFFDGNCLIIKVPENTTESPAF